MTREEKEVFLDSWCNMISHCKRCPSRLQALCGEKLRDDYTDEELDGVLADIGEKLIRLRGPLPLEGVQENSDKETEEIFADFDVVNRPAHYTKTSIECIDAMRETQGDEAVKAFCVCNAFKYLWRHNRKNGDEDIKKANWYLNKAVEIMEGEKGDN